MRRRQKRSIFSPLSIVNWILNHLLGMKTNTEKDISKIFQGDTLDVSNAPDISGDQIAGVPSDFFQMVNSSDLTVSPYSKNHDLSQIRKNDLLQLKAVHKRKRWKSFPSSSSPPAPQSWSGILTSSRGMMSCPAYLIDSSHALITGSCALRTMPGTLSVMFSVHRVRVDRVTMLCAQSGAHCALAVLSTSQPLPASVGRLCFPAEQVDRLMGVELGDRGRLREWIGQAVNN